MKEININKISEQYGVVKTAVNKLSNSDALRFAFIVLPYSLNHLAIEREIMVDYETNHIYFKKSDGTIGSKTVELEDMINKLLGNSEGGDPEMGNRIPIQVEGIQATTLGEALLELLNRIQKEKEQSPYKTNVEVTTTSYLQTLAGFPLIDGYQTKAGDRILVRNQINPEDNGIYVIEGSARWTKPDDFNEVSDIARGMTTMVMNGDSYANHLFTLTSIDGNPKIVHVTRNIMKGSDIVIVDDDKRTIDLVKPFENVNVTDRTGTLVEVNEYGVVESIGYIKTFNVVSETSNKTFNDSQMVAIDYTGKIIAGGTSDSMPNFE